MELLVIIGAIILLISLVVVSSRTPRQRARDNKRVDNLKQIFQALQLYYTTSGSYPLNSNQLAPDFIPVLPTDPIAGSVYEYWTDGTNAPQKFILKATLERSDIPALKNSLDDPTCSYLGPPSGCSCDITKNHYCLRP